jgi:hypothetical protein
MRTGIIAAAAAIALFSRSAAGQRGGEISLFGHGLYRGVRNNLNGPVQFARPLVVRSLAVSPSTPWELCSGKTFSGCRQVEGSIPSMVMTVRSARPIAPMLPASAALHPGATLVGKSLRGMASEFFVAPEESGNRVEVMSSATEAMAGKADQYCRSRGWRSAVHGRLQTAGGKVFLADVLCSDTGRISGPPTR